MVYVNSNQISTTKPIKITFVIVVLIVCFVFGFRLDPGFPQVRISLNRSYLSDIQSKQQIIHSFPPVYNSTHLWSMRFVDENYFRLARLLPCQIVEYIGGPKIDKIHSCNYSSTNEYSIENTLQAQKWLYQHQHPMNCTNRKFAIIQNFAWSGFGATIHQIAWAFGMALAENRIAIYETPGYWFYGDCSVSTPDCVFLPITNCSIPSKPYSNQTIHISARMNQWPNPIHPPIFENRTFNWYRAQLLFYLMRYKSETLTYVQNTIAQYFQPPLIDLHHPYIAVYVRRSDKVKYKEMCQAYTLKQYFDLFDFDVRQVNVTRVYINSEDEQIFNEFIQINKQKQGYYKLLSVNATRNVVFASFNRMTKQQRGKIALEFLTDLFIEANADLHVGTLTSNWCRLVDAMRLALGKTIPYYTPENRYLMNTRKRR
ncbi:unnamed protein product [Rotaria sordida]|uniref:Alpha-(1,6)-fucosyltransferase N- and catalytic domain-containing protein n=1 Tax=Rotaria sordida TaxID=392033 RepID=A0A815LY25_9BILA|nr:unnamed protein product [Rotaria sordida]CAF1414796.1 unnamed protein product [Rotaria sordida]CAF1414803.1 unnamed protein product [Rotaria sordida]CAF3894902.1 unnamed protein product [Rotaria sordida]CAF3975674.1 unnamed protein product [Rotaria sordida]